MAEWFKAPVLKTGVPQDTGGSNPSPSAIPPASANKEPPMKKLALAAMAAALLATAIPASAAQPKRGGLIGGLVGCCFGIRSAADYNDGKDISVREWLRIVPFVGFVVAIVDTVDGYNGVTRSELHAAEPTYF